MIPGVANADQCADSAARSGLSTRLNLLSSEKEWEEEYWEGAGAEGILLIRGPGGVGAGGGSAGPSSLLRAPAPPPPHAPRYTHTQPRLDMHTERRLRAGTLGNDTHLSRCRELLPPAERPRGCLGHKETPALHEWGKPEQTCELR